MVFFFLNVVFHAILPQFHTQIRIIVSTTKLNEVII